MTSSKVVRPTLFHKAVKICARYSAVYTFRSSAACVLELKIPDVFSQLVFTASENLALKIKTLYGLYTLITMISAMTLLDDGSYALGANLFHFHSQWTNQMRKHWLLIILNVDVSSSNLSKTVVHRGYEKRKYSDMRCNVLSGTGGGAGRGAKGPTLFEEKIIY